MVWGEERAPGSKFPPVFHYTNPSAEGRTKAIGFDIDWTIIQTKSGRKFATSSADWKWWDESVPKKLRELDAEGYRLVFFTNQGGVEKGKVTIQELQSKFEAIVSGINADIFVFASTGESHFRKPSPLMWDLFESKFNGGFGLNKLQCKYIGDAAGRPKEWSPGKSKDFSCSDRMFAANVGVDFATPEEFFLGQRPVKFQWGSVDPNSLAVMKTNQLSDVAGKKQEMVILMGCPASGKSSFFKRHFEKAGYVHVNRDTLSTPAKCLKVAKEALDGGSSVVIDNTNPSKFARAEYLKLAKASKVPSRLFHLETPRDTAHHLNYVRQNRTQGKVRRIPDVAYNSYYKNFEAPSKAEGFDDVISIPFAPSFDDDKHKQIFLQWTA